MNYDYDSEAEWEEPEEGEELNSEGEEELGDEDDADDMDGFLDDEETEGNGPKRRHLMGDIQPVCSSLHWEGGPGQVPVTSIPYGQTTLDLAPFRFGVLLGRHP
jgi:chromatin assembly factor 1 subunit A